jgi:hypothetical protein
LQETRCAANELKPAGPRENLIVTAEAGQISTENSTITSTLNSRAITELPRDSRDIYSLHSRSITPASTILVAAV